MESRIMRKTHLRRVARAGLWAALSALTFTTVGASAVDARVASAASGSGAAPVVRVEGGAVRGAAISGTYEFLGLPNAAPPTANLRWRPPQRPAAWAAG
jgi:para-nitrobenzyl esterase